MEGLPTANILKRPFVCYGSFDLFGLPPDQSELGHLRKNLEADDTASFYFVDGLYDVEPSPDIEYQCPPPNLIHFEYAALPLSVGFQGLAEILTSKDLGSPEDSMRRIWHNFGPKNDRNATSVTLEYINNVIEEEGPFHGVIGASEGGVAAASLLFDHFERCGQNDIPATMLCGVFFVSPPGLRADGKGWILSDETDQRIRVPTCHVFSDGDPLSWMSRCLASTCQEEGKSIILHDKGHTIPHTEELMVDIAKFVRKVKAHQVSL